MPACLPACLQEYHRFKQFMDRADSSGERAVMARACVCVFYFLDGADAALRELLTFSASSQKGPKGKKVFKKGAGQEAKVCTGYGQLLDYLVDLPTLPDVKVCARVALGWRGAVWGAAGQCGATRGW
jgi:hypothetical protein